MTKSKTHNELEHLRGEIRALKAENRHLKKQLKQLERREHFYEEQDGEMVTDTEETRLTTCSECFKGTVSIIDLGVYKFSVCSTCDIRKRI